MANSQIAKRDDKAPDAGEEQAKSRLAVLETEATLVPDVDICEDKERVRLLADMPYVDSGSVNVTVENNVLTIQGRASVEWPEECELIAREYVVGRYRRDFTLSDAADTTGIKARVKAGVLEVTIPKREEVKMRKISVEA